MPASRTCRGQYAVVLAASLPILCSASHVTSFSPDSSGLQGITVTAYGGGADPQSQCREGGGSFVVYDVPIDPQAEYPANCQAINAGGDDVKYYSGYCTPDKTEGVLLMYDDSECTQLRLNLSQSMDSQLTSNGALALDGVTPPTARYSFLTGSLPIGPIVSKDCATPGAREYADGCDAAMSLSSRLLRQDGLSSCIGPMHGNGSSYTVTSGEALDPSVAMMYLSFKCDISCFPSASMVRLADGTAARIDSLHHGDSILAAAEDGSLYMDTVSVFSLANSAVSAPMISLRIDGGRRLRFTASHHIPVGPACCSNLAQAKDVRRGDTVWVAAPGARAAEPRRVAHVAAELGKGLHNPLLTHGGFPVVDDVVTSFNSIGVVRLDRTLVPPLAAACAATGGCDAVRRLISSVDCLFAANCKDQRFVDGLVLQARAQHAADVAWPLASALLVAIATAGAAGASFLALRMNKSESQSW